MHNNIQISDTNTLFSRKKISYLREIVIQNIQFFAKLILYKLINRFVYLLETEAKIVKPQIQ